MRLSPNYVIEHLAKLNGLKWTTLGRATDMCWMGFGGPVYRKNFRGEVIKTGQYALHLECAWRIVEKESRKIVLSSREIYEPASYMNWSEEFDWDIQGNNLFDEKVIKWRKENREIYVVSAYSYDGGDLSINLSNDWIIESFFNESTSSESWRFFEIGSEHLVCRGDGFFIE